MLTHGLRQGLQQTQRLTMAQIQAIGTLALDQEELTQAVEALRARNPFIIRAREAKPHALELTDELAAQIAEKIDDRDEYRQDLQTMPGDPLIKLLARLILDECNEHGFCPLSDETLMHEYARVLAEEHVRTMPEDWRQARELLGSLEPGLGQPDVKTSLLCQLQNFTRPDDEAAVLFLKQAIHRGLRSLTPEALRNSAQASQLPEAVLTRALAIEAVLNPYPWAVADAQTGFIVPELQLHFVDNAWTVSLNKDAVPAVALVEGESLEALKTTLDAPTYKAQLQEALRFIQALGLRHKTLLALGMFIATHQAEFALGSGPLSPLTQKQASHALGLSESSLSRLVQHKYAQTPSGVKSLQSFFSARGSATFSGDAVDAQLRALIDHEDPRHPLSDSMLQAKLAEAGYPLARRTVALYRQRLGYGAMQARKLTS